MNKRRFKRAALLLVTMCLLIAGTCAALWLRLERRKEALNRQLIAALVKDERARAEQSGPYDHREALSLVIAGADPNTPVKPLPTPSLRQLWDYLVHRSPLPANHCQTAFLLACGTGAPGLNIFPARYMGSYEDFAPLVQAMLQHGANIEAEDENGCTGLVSATQELNLKTLDILLEHGFNVNGHRGDFSPLYWAIFFSCNPPLSSPYGTPSNGAPQEIVLRLLGHGADPNLHEPDGTTALQAAQLFHRPDLVALLKQAEAKK